MNNNNTSSYLTVVMPAYNEGTRIKSNLIEAAKIISEFAPEYMIIAVNDGSSDNTEEEIKLAMKENSRIKMISYDENKGKGYAIRRGMHASTSLYTAFLDSDLELPPYLLKDYLATIQSENADIVIGSKMHKDSKIEYPFVRKVISLGYYTFLKILFRLKLKDTQTGIKLFKTESIKPVLKLMKSTGFTFDIELLAIATRMGLKICERPVELNYSRNEASKSKISIKQIFKMFNDTIKIKKRVDKINF